MRPSPCPKSIWTSRRQKKISISLSLERSMFKNFAFRVTGLYSRRFDILGQQNILRGPEVYTIANNRPDPGPDGRVGTADDTGQTLTWWEYPDAYRPVQYQLNQLVGDPNATEYFKTIEVTGQKRLSNGWQLLASYSATHSDIPVPEVSNMNPNTYILAANNTWEWLARASGAYVFPKRDHGVSQRRASQWRRASANGGAHGRQHHSDDHAEGRVHRQPSPPEPDHDGLAVLEGLEPRERERKLRFR